MICANSWLTNDSRIPEEHTIDSVPSCLRNVCRALWLHFNSNMLVFPGTQLPLPVFTPIGRIGLSVLPVAEAAHKKECENVPSLKTLKAVWIAHLLDPHWRPGNAMHSCVQVLKRFAILRTNCVELFIYLFILFRSFAKRQGSLNRAWAPNQIPQLTNSSRKAGESKEGLGFSSKIASIQLYFFFFVFGFCFKCWGEVYIFENL